jgi:two-component system heavy metal sensor histidine kinase CusS
MGERGWGVRARPEGAGAEAGQSGQVELKSGIRQRSLRGRLTVWLLAGTGLLLTAGGLLLDRVIGSSLRREFDVALVAEAKSLMMSTEQRAGTVWLEVAEGALPEFAPGEKPDYFQMWLGQGAVLARSPSLGTRDLPRSRRLTADPRLYDLTLPDGRPGRRVEISFRPQMEQDDDREGKGEGESVSPAPPGSPPVALVVAQSREDLDAFLASLHLTLALVVLGLLAATAILVKAAVGLGLKPLDALADRLEAMDAGSLGEAVVIADAPAELLPTIRHLNGLLARLKESFERERTFAANLAHELRTPLAELRAVTEVGLKWPEDSASWLESLAEIRGIGLQMENVVVNLLALARWEGKQYTVQTSRVPLRELAAGCWSNAAAEAEAKGMTLALEIPEGLAIVTDREKLGLILSNLLSNAAAHGSPGGVVTCSATISGDDFTLRVANPTAELTPADLPRIFDRFWRKDAARSSGRHAGLGLSLVSALCELLGFRKEARLRGGVFEIILSGPHGSATRGAPVA